MEYVFNVGCEHLLSTNGVRFQCWLGTFTLYKWRMFLHLFIFQVVLIERLSKGQLFERISPWPQTSVPVFKFTRIDEHILLLYTLYAKYELNMKSTPINNTVFLLQKV